MPIISGRVIEKWSKTPVANAVVHLAGKSTLTGVDGSFSIYVEMPGTYLLRVVKAGYEEASSSITIPPEGVSIIVELTPIFKAL